MIKFFIGPFAIWFPIIATAIILGLAVLLYIYRSKLSNLSGWESKILNFRFVIVLSAASVVINAIIYTLAQYIIWSQSSFSHPFLNSPLDAIVPETVITKLFPLLFQSDLGYFFFYSWGRFWLKAIIILMFAYGFWVFLKILKKYKDRFFNTGEVELGLIISLLVGWPNFVIFIPMVFLFVVLVSIFRGIFLKEPYTTLGWPFILAGIITIIWGDYLIELFNLGVLRI